MKEVTVFATITAKKEAVAQVLAELQILVPAVQQEPGCIAYKLHQNVRQPELFHFYEIWGSQELLDQHAIAPALTAFKQKTAGLLTGLDVFVAKPV
ncbi:MAG: antibiotic biosynthesis monooxygenase [Verrucomicrobiales bacterium]|jgi:quinol monooxygenase YgiN|nr:antibiotic biosynthesis monooxygenase [Verrucomicrobiales bacterium]